MKKFKKYIWVFMIVALVIPGLVTANSDVDKISAYTNLIIEKSDTVIERSDLLEDMINGAFSETDKYSNFQKINTFNTEQNTYINAEYVGIGVSMQVHEKGVMVVSVFDYSPAAFVGLATNDVIVSVGGINIAEKDIQYIASLVKGPAGTKVRLGVLKNNSGSIIYYDLDRQVVAMKTVKSYIMNDVGYVYISSFTNETGNEFRSALEKFANSDVTDVILDLRNNGGGTLQGSISTVRELLSDCTITKMDFKNPMYLDIRYVASLKDINYNVVLLVNEYSASASEIVTGALKDNDAALVVGEKTFGKSVVQSSYKILTQEKYQYYSELYDVYDMYMLVREISMNGIQLEDDSYIGAAKLTIGEYLTPSGESINLTGIEPDVLVEYDGKLYIDNNKLEGMLWIREKYDIGMVSYEIYKAKVVLKNAGYDIGNLNVSYDETFKSAVKNFQADCGLYPYGVLDYTTQDHVNNIIRQGKLSEDLQLAAAFELIKDGE